MKYMKTNIAYIPIAEARGITLKVDKTKTEELLWNE